MGLGGGVAGEGGGSNYGACGCGGGPMMLHLM